MIMIGTVTYNPDLDKLITYTQSLIGKYRMIIVDNCSNNYTEIQDAISPEVELISQDKNYGIAHALNIIMETAKKSGADWVLTLDQDTEISEESIQELINHTKENVGVLCPVCNERGGQRIIKTKGAKEYIEECITAGQLTRIDAWEAVGGYDEKLFIDFVDFDFCWRLGEAGIKIMRINTASIIQEVGELNEIKFFRHYIYARNHSPIRHYYIMRNRLYCIRRLSSWKKKQKEVYQLIVQTTKTLLFETNRIDKIMMMTKGVIDSHNL